ncbi:3D domain-containing protein [Virgibacillus ainsalahensis]
MKKLVATLTGVIIAGITATSVSAADYQVEKGDSLWNIANENNTSVEALMDINGLNSHIIHPNQVLQLNENEYYVVQQGDTLNGISTEHGVSVADLKAWNNLSSNLIITGQELAVNGAKPVEQEAPQETEETAASPEAEPETQETEEAAASPKAEPETQKAEETVASTETSEPKAETTESNTEKTEVKTEPKEQETKSEQAEGKTISVESTAYTAGCSGCSGVTATGMNLNENPNAKVIAVDPNVIPLGTEVYVEGYGHAVAADTGGAINGNKIDVHVPTKDQAYSWGRKTVDVTIVE